MEGAAQAHSTQGFPECGGAPLPGRRGRSGRLEGKIYTRQGRQIWPATLNTIQLVHAVTVTG